MDAKEYLQQAFKIDRIIKSKLEQVARLESLATSASQSFSQTGPSAHDDSKGSKLENLVVSIVDLKEEAQKQMEELAKRRLEISKTISGVGNLTLQYVLEERYLLYKTWDEIRGEMGFSQDYLFRLHKRGLERVDHLINS